LVFIFHHIHFYIRLIGVINREHFLGEDMLSQQNKQGGEKDFFHGVFHQK
jgi:hypothetical protein